jgi:GT2 family glycosyltransferase
MAAASVSAVIVNYNGGTLLERCVLKLLASGNPALERVIVSDNGSTDHSLSAIRSIAKADTRVEIIENGANIGFAAANNRALPQVTGDYVLFINPDCIVEAATISRMVEVMELNPQAGMAGCLVRNPDGTEQRGCRRNLPTPASALERVLKFELLFPRRLSGFDLTGTPMPSGPVEVEAISGAFMFVRKRALDTVGPMDEEYFLHCEDLDWCMRFNQAGWKILFVPDAIATHAQGSSSRTAPVAVEFHKHRGMIRYYRKFHRQRYPRALLWLVTAGVWLRFVAKAVWLKLKKSL